MNNEIVVTIGIPASGKSMLAETKYPDHIQIERDQLRKAFYDQGQKWSKELENSVTMLQKKLVMKAVKDNLNIIISDTNINANTRKGFNKLAENVGYEYKEEIVRCDLKLALERNARRTGWKCVPPKVIKSMYTSLTEQFPIPYERPEAGSKPLAYIFDLDGTLAHMVDRSPYDWKAVGRDRLDEAILTILENFKYNHIIIMSGRDSICYDETREWLHEFKISYDDLIMRPKGCNLKDSVVKHDLFHKYVADNYDIIAVFDDRQQVVDMWRKMGLKCLQVAPGDF